ncbi:PREDICTED: proactivator polypeptide-like isoform X1 [Poecilia mexicana]|uniref:proactivator polypeptide-like isoform X1 n=1 Tax=Poecilia mexicana TaxID=48701 RepID=UPI00072DEBD2|nr:PREDICTED: proactivator polypeptide-like isoform X1 [Poecilia mexicana]
MSASGFVLLVLAASLCSGDSRFIFDSSTGQKPLTQGVCPECSQIIQLSANMVFSRDTKVTVFKALHGLCRRLPEEQASECESQVKIYLPKILQQTSSQWKPEEICEVFGLCATRKDRQAQLHHVPSKDTAGSPLGSEVHVSDVFNPVCTLCLMVIKKLETMLPKNMTEETLKKLMEEVCDLIPSSYKDQCDDFVDKYGAEIVEFLLTSAAPHTICSLLHLCLFEPQPAAEVDLTSDCDSCQTLAALSRLHLGLNATEPQTSAFLQSVCALHPKAIPKCDAFTRIHGPELQKILGNQMDVPRVCEKTGLCISSKKLEPLGNNPCTWGPNYWCKNINTAQECGNQVFCENYMWKN